jgi:hypothetical protein
VFGEGAHAGCVEAWLEGAAKDLSPQRLVQLFEAALGVLWARTETTLGVVTLTAIAERVLYTAAQRLPPFSCLVVEPGGGIQCRALHTQLGSFSDAQLREGASFVLVEFLTVLGNLTADILTPELHAALSEVSLPREGTS